MAHVERVTVTLPADVVRDIERLERNRSKFVLEAIQRELERRRQDALRLSLQNPHQESSLLAEQGFEDWARTLPDEDIREFVDLSAGRPVRWVSGEGWAVVPE